MEFLTPNLAEDTRWSLLSKILAATRTNNVDMSGPGSDEGEICCGSNDFLLRIEITLKADVKFISPVVEGVMHMIREKSCASEREFQVELALREALANAVAHGCREDKSKEVQICVSCTESHGMFIVVRDSGPGFEPDSIANPTVGQTVYSGHGRGIFLIKQLMDEVGFERGGTEIHMRKK